MATSQKTETATPETETPEPIDTQTPETPETPQTWEAEETMLPNLTTFDCPEYVPISLKSDIGKKLALALQSTSRVVVNVDEVEFRVSAVCDECSTLPIVFAGGSLHVATEEATAVMMQFITRLLPDTGQKVGTNGKHPKGAHIMCLAIVPCWGVEDLIGTEEGLEWVSKIVEKETSHVQARPLRDVEVGEPFAPSAFSIALTMDKLVTAASRVRVDVSTLGLLWPLVREEIISRMGAMKAFLPTDSRVPEVSKALRSRDWAERNFPELEARGLFAIIGEMICAAAEERGEVDDDDGNSIPLNAAPIRAWLEARDEYIIEAAVPRTVADINALDDFAQQMRNLMNSDGDGDGDS